MIDATVVTAPAINPGICFRCRCGTETRKWFIDTGTDTDVEGRLYFCNMCMVDFVKLIPMEFVPAAAFQTGIEQVYAYFKNLSDKEDEVAQKLALINSFIESLQDVRGDGGRIINHYGENPTADVGPDLKEPGDESPVNAPVILPPSAALKFG